MNNLLSGKLTSRGNLNGNVNTIVFAHNYNDLTNKPSINNVTLQGNKTASDLGLATPSDITVTSVNDQTGDVILSGSDIDYSVGMSLNAKIDDIESQIQGSGVQSVNGMTGNVTLTSNDINYSTGVTIKNKIDSVEGEIPDEYVSTVNGNSGAVSITAQDIPMSGTDQTPTATAIGDLSALTTSDTSSLVGAVNEVVTGLGTKAKITRKKYSVTLASNAYISPFTYFFRLDIGTDTVSYGLPIGVWATNSAVTPHIENSYNIDCLGGSAITCDVYVFFASNVDVIS